MKKNCMFLISVMVLLPTLMFAQMQTIPTDLRNAFRQAGLTVFEQPIPARDFSLSLLDGSNRSLSALKGNVVFLNFWASWCGPCLSEMPSMEVLYQRFKNRGFTMLAVDIEESRSQVASFIKDRGFTFPVALDVNGDASSLYNITAIPTSYIINREGSIIAAVRGSMNWNTSEVFSAIEKLLAYTQ